MLGSEHLSRIGLEERKLDTTAMHNRLGQTWRRRGRSRAACYGGQDILEFGELFGSCLKSRGTVRKEKFSSSSYAVTEQLTRPAQKSTPRVEFFQLPKLLCTLDLAGGRLDFQQIQYLSRKRHP